MLNADDVAEYILNQNTLESDQDITHLKLQKLLYYCQGFHLAILGKPLFNDIIEHWDHGPVVPSVYKIYKQHGYDILQPAEEDMKDLHIPPESKNIIDEVLEVYNQFSARKLREMTHNESPWKETNDCDEITHDMLKNFFKAKIINEK